MTDPRIVDAGRIHVHAYAERLGVRAGEGVRIMASAEGVASVNAQLVRLIHGDGHPDGPGFREEEIDNAVNGDLPLSRQFVQRGNFLSIDDADGRLLPQAPFTLCAFINASIPGNGVQTLFSWRGSPLALDIDKAGRLNFSNGKSSLTLSKSLLPHIWYFIAASHDPVSGRTALWQHAVVSRYNGLWSRIVPVDYDDAAQGEIGAWSPACTGLLVGGRDADAEPRVEALYNGKIDRFFLIEGAAAADELEAFAAGAIPDAARLIAYWDTSEGYAENGIGDVVIDKGPFGLHAQGFNRPVRGQTGWNWDGRAGNFHMAPRQYGGIEFHDDALADCRWQPSAVIDVPADAKSGVYALRLTAPGSSIVERALFFVRPSVPTAKICMLMPTATYLAYGNGPRSMEGDVGQAIMGRTPVLSWRDIEACANGYEFGLSAYDTHRDGAGVCHVSARRPIFTMQPDYRNPGVAAPWGLAADLSIIAWLEHCGYDYDVLTDEDLHRDGAAALAPYKTVINGSHCEYYSERMLDATEDYLEAGGRLLYLSGNGYYWVVGFRPGEPWLMEVRRRQAGSRAWEGRPGEGYLASTGEPGGLWRHRNRAPQKLVGTGFAAEGMDVSFPYRRLPAAPESDAAWIFEGVDGDIIGNFGLIHGGAVGLEIDRFDPALGSPPHAQRLAASAPLTGNWPLVLEDVLFNHAGLGGDENPRARCDMVYFSTTNGGAVFSPSSIAWSGSLPVNNFDNDVSRIMRNVVDRFIGAGDAGP